jgi:hypothetical protein
MQTLLSFKKTHSVTSFTPVHITTSSAYCHVLLLKKHVSFCEKNFLQSDGVETLRNVQSGGISTPSQKHDCSTSPNTSSPQLHISFFDPEPIMFPSQKCVLIPETSFVKTLEQFSTSLTDWYA